MDEYIIDVNFDGQKDIIKTYASSVYEAVDTIVAIETITEYKFWLHGEAVGFGMILALDLSRSLGLIDTDDFNRVKQLISAANLPVKAPSNLNDVNIIIDLMGMDKKVINGKLRFILLNSIGQAFIHDSVPLDKLKEVLSRHVNNS